MAHPNAPMHFLHESDAHAKTVYKQLLEVEYRLEQLGSLTCQEREAVQRAAENLTERQLTVDAIADQRYRATRKSVTRTIQAVVGYADALLARKDFKSELKARLSLDFADVVQGTTLPDQWLDVLCSVRFDVPGRLRRAIQENSKEWSELQLSPAVKVMLELRLFGTLLPTPRGDRVPRGHQRSDWYRWWYKQETHTSA